MGFRDAFDKVVGHDEHEHEHEHGKHEAHEHTDAQEVVYVDDAPAGVYEDTVSVVEPQGDAYVQYEGSADVEADALYQYETYQHGEHGMNDDAVAVAPAVPAVTTMQVRGDDERARHAAGAENQDDDVFYADEDHDGIEVTDASSSNTGVVAEEEDDFVGEAPAGLEDEEEIAREDPFEAVFEKSRDEGTTIYLNTLSRAFDGVFAGVVTGYDDQYVLIQNDQRGNRGSAVVQRDHICGIRFEQKH